MEKVESDYLFAIVLFDTIMHSVSTPMKFKRSRFIGELGNRSRHLSVIIFLL